MGKKTILLISLLLAFSTLSLEGDEKKLDYTIWFGGEQKGTISTSLSTLDEIASATIVRLDADCPYPCERLRLEGLLKVHPESYLPYYYKLDSFVNDYKNFEISLFFEKKKMNIRALTDGEEGSLDLPVPEGPLNLLK
jgi:hypothetical protein